MRQVSPQSFTTLGATLPSILPINWSARGLQGPENLTSISVRFHANGNGCNSDGYSDSGSSDRDGGSDNDCGGSNMHLLGLLDCPARQQSH